MQIDYALILSAGLGTRMGEIGKQLPKVLWPVFFKTLLELQIDYCKDLGIKKIFINTHFLHDDIVEFLKTSSLIDQVIVLHEKTLLDSGGAIHNLAALEEVDYKGLLLLVNGDQFLFFEDEIWQMALRRVQSCRAVLFGITIDKDSSYNETIIEQNRLVGIEKNIGKLNNYTTYSGLGLLNLSGLKPVPGISKFFETVANFKLENIEMLTLARFEYWDFGTADIYAKNIFKLKNESNLKSMMGHFLNRHAAFTNNLNENDLRFLDVDNHSIDLDYTGKFCENSIHGKGIFQKI
jgi:mannose-1-phosphate guanylyltransferase